MVVKYWQPHTLNYKCYRDNKLISGHWKCWKNLSDSMLGVITEYKAVHDYLCSTSCPPCIVTDQSLRASHSRPKTPTHCELRCPCESTRLSLDLMQSCCVLSLQTSKRHFILHVCVPVYKAFTLQISQCCAELVGKQNESGQIQTVLPHLKERTQLWTESVMRNERLW